MCFCLLSFLFVISLFRGSSKNPSIINITKCGGLDWTLFFGAVVLYLMIFILNVTQVRHTEEVKQITQIGVHPKDITF